MAFKIQRVDYYHLTLKDQPGEAYKFLSTLANAGLDLLAFTAIPLGGDCTQLTVFPKDSLGLEKIAKYNSLNIEGPHRALLASGDDELGALAKLHMKLFKAGVNVSASSGVADGKDGYGYLLYIRSDEYDKAVKALDL